MTEITDGSTTVAPMLVLGWNAANALRSVVHAVLGSSSPDVTLRPSATRTGTLEVLCEGESQANEIVAMHTQGVVLTLIEDDLTSISMDYVVSGEVVAVLEDVTRQRWIVTIPYAEVIP